MSYTIEEAEQQAEKTSLVESLVREWIKLPHAVMQDCGPAAQTLGGILKITSKETFVDVATIAAKARLPVATLRKHLVTLDARGWIQNKGRGETRRGRLRRTCTIGLTAKTLDHVNPYGVLPWWACCTIAKVGRFPWSSKAVLSLVMARLMSFAAAVDRQDGCGADADDVEGTLANWGDQERWHFPLGLLTRDTGLDHKSVTSAKRFLCWSKVVRWVDGSSQCGDDKGHILAPNWEFQVVVRPTSPGYCSLAFKG